MVQLGATQTDEDAVEVEVLPHRQLGVERGLLKPGDTLFDPGQRNAARIRADGSLVCKDATGSIHKMGAHVMGAEACNGWTFWHFRRSGKMMPIDVLRQKVRAEMKSA